MRVYYAILMVIRVDVRTLNFLIKKKDSSLYYTAPKISFSWECILVNIMNMKLNSEKPSDAYVNIVGN